MSNSINSDANLPACRWDILRTIHTGQRLGTTEKILFNTLICDYLDVTRDVVRNQLTYLERRELITLDRHSEPSWRAHLTRVGWDLVEHRIECDAGIRRPPRPSSV